MLYQSCRMQCLYEYSTDMLPPLSYLKQIFSYQTVRNVYGSQSQNMELYHY